MDRQEQKFRTVRFPSGKQPDRALLERFQQENNGIKTNARKYSTAYREHTNNSSRFILDSAVGIRGKAIILGMGQGIDIPVEDLAKQFDELLVVDIDESTSARKLGTLDPDLQRRFTLVVEDLTGMLVTLGSRLKLAESQAFSLQLFLSSMAKVWKDMDPVLPNFGQDYSFVCSSLLTTQLASQPHLRFSAIVVQKFDLASGMIHGREALDYFTSLTTLANRLHTDHLDLIRGSLLPNGRAYYADTIAETATIMNPLTGEVLMAGDWKIMAQPHLVNYEIPQRFTVLEEREWLWNRKPPTLSSRGSTFSVLAFNLKPLVKP